MRKRKFKVKSFCRLDADLIEGDAFMDLSGKWALVCLIRFHQKAYKKNLTRGKKGKEKFTITNNGELVFTYGEAAELGIKSSSTFYRVLRELVQEKGFIEIAEHGNWFNKEPTKFAISERWRLYGTKEFKRVKLSRVLHDSQGFQKQNTLR